MLRRWNEPMYESILRPNRGAFGKLALLVTLSIYAGAACSSTSQTNVVVAQGGSDSTGGSSEQPGGGTVGTVTNSAGGAGGAGGANCAAGATLVPELHAACIEDLGQGKVRITYDFASANQALDWSPATDATVAVNQGALVVTAPTGGGIGAAIFKKQLHVDKASFRVLLLSGSTTNWYINTLWSGSWNPDAGYGAYHDTTGRGFIINGTEYSPSDVSPLSVGVMHNNTVEQSDTQIKWTQDGTVMTETVTPLPVTNRILALGAYDSSAAFYNVVFEGTLN